MTTATVSIKVLTWDEIIAGINEVDATATVPDPVMTKPRDGDERLAHLVLKDSWPTALCGATVEDRFGNSAPAMDRCHECIKIAADRSLGRPGWTE